MKKNYRAYIVKRAQSSDGGWGGPEQRSSPEAIERSRSVAEEAWKRLEDFKDDKYSDLVFTLDLKDMRGFTWDSGHGNQMKELIKSTVSRNDLKAFWTLLMDFENARDEASRIGAKGLVA